jgi:hypothetical protein
VRGASVPIAHAAWKGGEEEIMVRDGTVMKTAAAGYLENCECAFARQVVSGGRVGAYPGSCVRIESDVDWEQVEAYFPLYEQACTIRTPSFR